MRQKKLQDEKILLGNAAAGSADHEPAGLGRREFLATGGTVLGVAAAIGAPALLFPRVASGDTIPVPKLSASLPDPVGKGYLIWDPRPIDYVVDEYFMSGTASTYSGSPVLPAPGGPPALAFDAPPPKATGTGPYITRIVVYRPADMKRFSGNVIIECFHPRGYVECWSVLNRYYGTRGDVSVHIQQPQTFPGASTADRFYGAITGYKSDRYASLSRTDDTQLWDMLAQVAMLMKSRTSPVGRPARRIYVTGYSATSGPVNGLARVFHKAMRMPDGKPLYDGYLPMTGIQRMPPLDVPVVGMATQSDFFGGARGNVEPNLRETFDSDDPSSRRRHYELAGVMHGPLQTPEPDASVAPPDPNFTFGPGCKETYPVGAIPSDLPDRFIMEGMFHNMSEWVDRGIAPPKAPLMEVENGRAKPDADGNPIGGLRLPNISVPVASYGVGSGTCQLNGYKVFFTPERCKQLHGSETEYLAKFDAACEKMVADRFVVAESVGRLKQTGRVMPKF